MLRIDKKYETKGDNMGRLMIILMCFVLISGTMIELHLDRKEREERDKKDE